MKTIKNILILALVALATIYFYNETKPKPKLAVVEVVEVVEEKPAPIVVKEIPKPVEVKEEVRVNSDKLPDGVFYVRERVTLKNENGIFSFSVGEKVNEIGRENGNPVVSNGKFSLTVEPWKLTDSKSYGEMLNKKLQEQNVIRIPDVSVAVEVVEPPTPSQTPTPLAVPTVDRNAAIDAQIQVLRDKINHLERKDSSKINANGPTITRLEMEIKKLEAQK